MKNYILKIKGIEYDLTEWEEKLSQKQFDDFLVELVENLTGKKIVSDEKNSITDFLKLESNNYREETKKYMN
jgi:hypothetical protein